VIAVLLVRRVFWEKHNEPRITRDDEAYITESYVVLDTDNRKLRKSSYKAELFLPEYEDIREEIANYEFYTVVKWLFTSDDYLYVLDTHYQNQSKYDAKKQELLEQHRSVSQPFVDNGSVVSRKIGKYDCYIGGESDCVFGYGGGKGVQYGMYYGIYCFDDVDKTIRYVYYYNGTDADSEIDIVSFEEYFDWWN